MRKCVICGNKDNSGNYCEQCHMDRDTAEDWDDC